MFNNFDFETFFLGVVLLGMVLLMLLGGLGRLAGW